MQLMNAGTTRLVNLVLVEEEVPGAIHSETHIYNPTTKFHVLKVITDTCTRSPLQTICFAQKLKTLFILATRQAELRPLYMLDETSDLGIALAAILSDIADEHIQLSTFNNIPVPARVKMMTKLRCLSRLQLPGITEV